MDDGIYERELPTDDPPEVVNALYSSGNIGTPNMDGFEAAILNLIDKKVLSIETVTDKDTSGLKSNEKQVYDILHRFSNNDQLNLSSLNSKLSTESNAKWFMGRYKDWQENVCDSLEFRTDEEFDYTGTTIIAVLGVGGLLCGVLLAILGFWTELKSGIYAIAGGIFLIIFSLLIMKLDDDKFGKWTPEGRVRYLKWKNFKKFLNDYSLIKEHPPESIVIWKKYTVQ